jgi:antitoxin ParD1/3/4
MTKVAIQVPDDLEPFLAASVKTGAFSDAGEFVVNLLYNVKAQSESELSEEQQAKLAALRAEIAVGIEQAERGDFVEFTAEDIIAEGMARRAAAVAR